MLSPMLIQQELLNELMAFYHSFVLPPLLLRYETILL